MTRDVRTHIGDSVDPGATPKHLTKQEFGRRLYVLMMKRGWRQSDLARAADMPRDSVSTYIRGKVLPTPQNLQKLAEALGVQPSDLLPNHIESAIGEDAASLEFRVSVSEPNMAWLRVNRLVKLSTATKIAELLERDRAASDAD